MSKLCKEIMPDIYTVEDDDNECVMINFRHFEIFEVISKFKSKDKTPIYGIVIHMMNKTLKEDPHKTRALNFMYFTKEDFTIVYDFVIELMKTQYAKESNT